MANQKNYSACHHLYLRDEVASEVEVSIYCVIIQCLLFSIISYLIKLILNTTLIFATTCSAKLPTVTAVNQL